MREVAVHLPIGHKPEIVQVAAAAPNMRDRAEEHGVGGKRARTNRVGDPHQLLIDNAPSANVLMPNLGVAHDRAIRTNGKPNILATGSDERAGKLTRKPGINRSGRAKDRVGRVGLAMRRLTPAVANDEHARNISKRGHTESLTNFGLCEARCMATLPPSQ